VTDLLHKNAGQGLLGGCTPDCPACAVLSAERAQSDRLLEGVREIVLGMYLEAIAAGERDIEWALRDITPALAKLTWWERSRIGWQFVQAALKTKVIKKRARKPQRPTAWRKANRGLVDLVARERNLPKTSPYEDINPSREARETAYTYTAALWREYGFDVQSYDVKAAYHDKRKPKRAARKK
jgi:hypothetical protein